MRYDWRTKAIDRCVNGVYVNQEGREKILAAFKDLRKEGLICKANFSCCGGCAASEIGTLTEERRAKGKAVLGGCHWNRQTEQALKDTGVVHISYGAADGSSLTTFDVGVMLLKALLKNGVMAEWDGDPASTVIAYTSEDAYDRNNERKASYRRAA